MQNGKESDVKNDSKVLGLETGRLALVITEMGNPAGGREGGGEPQAV